MVRMNPEGGAWTAPRAPQLKGLSTKAHRAVISTLRYVAALASNHIQGCPVKAKLHYISWFGAGSKLVRTR